MPPVTKAITRAPSYPFDRAQSLTQIAPPLAVHNFGDIIKNAEAPTPLFLNLSISISIVTSHRITWFGTCFHFRHRIRHRRQTGITDPVRQLGHLFKFE